MILELSSGAFPMEHKLMPEENKQITPLIYNMRLHVRLIPREDDLYYPISQCTGDNFGQFSHYRP